MEAKKQRMPPDLTFHPIGEGEDGDEQRMPNCFDYFLHIMTIFWKILFAFVPPTAYWNGWACFVISIMVIGFLTAIIGDLASHFGCTVGLRDTVTAVVFVALGTSIPGQLNRRRGPPHHCGNSNLSLSLSLSLSIIPPGVSVISCSSEKSASSDILGRRVHLDV